MHISEQMIDRAASVILEPPGLQYFPGPEAMASNRQVIARALAAAMGEPGDDAPSEEDRIAMITRAGMENPGCTASIGPDGNVVLSPGEDL